MASLCHPAFDACVCESVFFVQNFAHKQKIAPKGEKKQTIVILVSKTDSIINIKIVFK